MKLLKLRPLSVWDRAANLFKIMDGDMAKSIEAKSRVLNVTERIPVVKSEKVANLLDIQA